MLLKFLDIVQDLFVSVAPNLFLICSETLHKLISGQHIFSNWKNKLNGLSCVGGGLLLRHLLATAWSLSTKDLSTSPEVVAAVTAVYSAVLKRCPLSEYSVSASGLPNTAKASSFVVFPTIKALRSRDSSVFTQFPGLCAAAIMTIFPLVLVVEQAPNPKRKILARAPMSFKLLNF